MESLGRGRGGGGGGGEGKHGNETKLVMVQVKSFAAVNMISFSLSGYIQACTWQGLKLQYEL